MKTQPRSVEARYNHSLVGTLADFRFARTFSPTFVRILYALGVAVIGLNAILAIVASAVGFGGFGISINGFDGSDFFTSVEEPQPAPNPASVLLSVVIYSVVAIFEIAMLRIVLEIAAALTSTAVAWDRIKRRQAVPTFLPDDPAPGSAPDSDSGI